MERCSWRDSISRWLFSAVGRTPKAPCAVSEWWGRECRAKFGENHNGCNGGWRSHCGCFQRLHICICKYVQLLFCYIYRGSWSHLTLIACTEAFAVEPPQFVVGIMIINHWFPILVGIFPWVKPLNGFPWSWKKNQLVFFPFILVRFFSPFWVGIFQHEWYTTNNEPLGFDGFPDVWLTSPRSCPGFAARHPVWALLSGLFSVWRFPSFDIYLSVYIHMYIYIHIYICTHDTIE